MKSLEENILRGLSDERDQLKEKCDTWPGVNFQRFYGPL